MIKKSILSLALFTTIVIISVQISIAEERTLFERLGGTPGITAIVEDVIEAHMNNPAINERFLPYRDQPERLAKIKQHIIDFFSAGSGGPVEYKGRDMKTTHKGMDITPADYMHVMDDIMGVLEKHKIDDESKKDVLYILWSLKKTIIAKDEMENKEVKYDK